MNSMEVIISRISADVDFMQLEPTGNLKERNKLAVVFARRQNPDALYQYKHAELKSDQTLLSPERVSVQEKEEGLIHCIR
jgi:hypothetical protein